MSAWSNPISGLMGIDTSCFAFDFNAEGFVSRKGWSGRPGEIIIPIVAVITFSPLRCASLFARLQSNGGIISRCVNIDMTPEALFLLAFAYKKRFVNKVLRSSLYPIESRWFIGIIQPTFWGETRWKGKIFSSTWGWKNPSQKSWRALQAAIILCAHA